MIRLEALDLVAGPLVLVPYGHLAGRDSELDREPRLVLGVELVAEVKAGLQEPHLVLAEALLVLALVFLDLGIRELMMIHYSIN